MDASLSLKTPQEMCAAMKRGVCPPEKHVKHSVARCLCGRGARAPVRAARGGRRRALRASGGEGRAPGAGAGEGCPRCSSRLSPPPGSPAATLPGGLSGISCKNPWKDWTLNRGPVGREDEAPAPEGAAPAPGHVASTQTGGTGGARATAVGGDAGAGMTCGRDSLAVAHRN